MASAAREGGNTLVSRPPLRFVKAFTIFASVSGLLVATASCTASKSGPKGEFASVWQQYTTLHPYRAIAVAGEISKNRWVVGMAGGAPSADDAIEAALHECRKQRELKRMTDSCRIYAVGNELRHQQQARKRHLSAISGLTGKRISGLLSRLV
jgi:hypothetical protein